jgi:uncharacterized membrane protein YeaQ/YmgE (transglycosylase-associated protein family)
MGGCSTREILMATQRRPRKSRKDAETRKIDDSKVEIIPPSARLPVDWRPLIVTAVVGMAGGWFASLLVGGSGILRYLVTGVLGALAAEHVCERLDVRLSIGHRWLDQIVIAAIGAVFVVLLARWIA